MHKAVMQPRGAETECELMLSLCTAHIRWQMDLVGHPLYTDDSAYS